jgi:uncharacterized protein with LGFP repeats
MEGYGTGTACVQTVDTFLNSWTTELQRKGYVSGVYGSSASTIADQAAAVRLTAGYHAPDDIRFADWNGCATDLDPSYFPDQYWVFHQRLHQYLANTTETWGGVTINIDRDYDNGAVAGPGGIGRVSPSCSGDAIEEKYQALGGVKSFLGEPVGTTYQVGDGLGQNYAAGAIYWSPATGAWSVHGAILTHYLQLGGPAGILGFPITDETGAPDGVGRYNHFQSGAIYWTPATGAHEVQGAIYAEWARLGWEGSVVGYPITDETGAPDGVGRYNHFQSGAIYWTPATGAHEVRGAIYAEWARLGWERSFLGYPTTDEFTPMSGYRQSDFQHGWIRWSSVTRAVSVS